MKLKRVGLLLGVLVFVALLILPPFETFSRAAGQFISEQQLTVEVSTLARSMQTVAALMGIMVI